MNKLLVFIYSAYETLGSPGPRFVVTEENQEKTVACN